MKNISLNFGAIKDTIYNYSSKELLKEGVKESKTMKSFLNEVKNNHILKIQYLIYKNFEKGIFKKERLAERYINQNLKLLEGVKWNDILETNKKLRQDLLNEYHVEGENEQKNKLYENIHILIESASRSNYNDISSSERAYEYILNHLLREERTETVKEENDMPKFFSFKYITELAVNNFNERYNHLNENEKKLLKVLLSEYNNKANYLAEIKSENLQLISTLQEENISEDNKKILAQFEQKMNGLPEINKENINEVIINCAELNETLKEI